MHTTLTKEGDMAQCKACRRVLGLIATGGGACVCVPQLAYGFPHAGGLY